MVGIAGAVVAVAFLGGLLIPPVRSPSAIAPAPVAFGSRAGTGNVGRAVPSVRRDSGALAGYAWTNMTTSASSAACSGAVYQACYAAWDPALGAVVVLGYSSSGASTETYRNGTFSPVSASTFPPPFFSGGIVYDAADGYLMVFGGENSSGASLNSTWIFSGTGWSELSEPVAPPPMAGFAMAYDPALSEVVLVGGYDALDGATFDQTWLFRSATWAQGPAFPSEIARAGLAYDPSTQQFLLAGGYLAPTVTATNLTWQFNASGWSQVATGAGSALPGGPMTLLPSPTGEGVVATPTGGQGYVLYLFQHQTWTNVSAIGGPYPTELDTVLVLDPADRTLLLFGGGVLSGPPTPVILSVPILWVLHGPIALAPRSDPADPLLAVGGSIELLAPATGGIGDYEYRWAYGSGSCPESGNGSGGPNGSVLVCSGRAAGNYSATVSVSDVADPAVNHTFDFTVVAGLSVGTPVPSSPGADAGERVTFTAPFVGGIGPWSVEWTGLPPGCGSASGPAELCLPSGPGTYSISATVTDATGSAVTSAALSFAVSPDLAVGAPAVVAPGGTTATDVGRPVNFSVAVTNPGGGGPYSYSWIGLPAGCPTSETATVACRPAAPGLYAVAVTVTDRNGYAVTSPATPLEVNGNLTALPTLGSGTVTAGMTSYWFAVVAGGTAPYSIDWYAGGAQIGSGPLLGYAFRTAGNVTVTVRVTDAAGSVSQANRTVFVAAAPAVASSGSGGLTAAEGAAIAVAVIVAIAALALSVVIFVRSRRDRPGAPGAADPPKGPA